MCTAALVALLQMREASAQSTFVVPYPADYKSNLVLYAVVDRSDGMSRDLYASRDAIEALKRNPRLNEFPVDALFAIDVYSARVVGRDPKTREPQFELSSLGRLLRSKSEHTLHVMQKLWPGFGSKNWMFGGYDPITKAPLKLQLPGDCLLCHQAALMSDMTFSMSLLKRSVERGAVQYSFCPRPGRQPCPLEDENRP